MDAYLKSLYIYIYTNKKKQGLSLLFSVEEQIMLSAIFPKLCPETAAHKILKNWASVSNYFPQTLRFLSL